MIITIKNKIVNRLLHFLSKPLDAKISYSQCGEDLIVQFIFWRCGILYPTYIDIGAHHPFHLSNTAFFYAKGCRGINIEANPELLKNFQQHRPQDVNLNIGIGPVGTTLDFYVMEDSSLSTFSPEEVNLMVSHHKKLQKKISIDVHPIDYVIKTYCNNVFPDFLSIDVEGWDYDILKTIDFNTSYPKVICVEAVEYSSRGDGKRRQHLIDFLLSKGYMEYANTNLNALMVKRKFWEESHGVEHFLN